MVGESGAAIAVTFFILVVPALLFFLPIIKKQFAKSEIVDLLLKRCCYILAIFLMTLNFAIVGEIANTFGLSGITSELFRYMWLLSWMGYLLLAFTGLKTLIDMLSLWKINKTNKRTGI